MMSSISCWAALICGYLVIIVTSHVEYPLLCVISFDGFRFDYLKIAMQEKINLPNFEKMVGAGVQAKWLQSNYITKTFPNHYSIVTGMYEEEHGVVGNSFYDPKLNRTFEMKDQSDSFMWNNGSETGGPEPIWVTNEKAPYASLKKRRSGVVMWPGSDVTIHGSFPSHRLSYDESINLTQRIDTLVSWFANEEDPISLGLLYFEEPDTLAHKVGPNSFAIMEKLKELDDGLGYLKSKLHEKHLLHHVNFIVTSDHGMMEVKGKVILEDLIDLSRTRVVGGSPVFGIFPHDKSETREIYEKLKKSPNLHVYLREEIPAKFHYQHNIRIAPIVAEAAAGLDLLLTNNQSVGWKKGHGMHGYNSSLPEMQAILIAEGPAFAKGERVGVVRNVDLYALMCRVLQIPPYTLQQGRLPIEMLLLEPIWSLTNITYIVTAAFCITLSLAFCIAACCTKVGGKPQRFMSLATVNGRTHLLSDLSSEDELI